MIKLQIAILNSNGDRNSARTNAVNLDIISIIRKFVYFFNNSNKKLKIEICGSGLAGLTSYLNIFDDVN